MENAIVRLTLDVQRTRTEQRISAKRGDSARTLIVTLTNRGSPYRIGEGCTAVFYARKSDGNPLFNDCTIENNAIRYDFTGQTTNVVGLVACEIRLYGADMRLLTSPSFDLYVEDSEYQEGDVPDSSPEYTALTEMVGRGTELLDFLEGLEGELTPIRDAAVEAQGNAAASAQEAMRAAETAAALAESAEGSAGAAAENAVAAAQAADAAQEALNEAKTAHADTERLAVRAEVAAQEAGTAAQEAWAAAAAAGKSNRLTLETEQSSDGDAGVVLEPEGTAEEPVLGLYGLNGDEPVRITHAAPAQADDDVPTLGQVRELVGEAGGVYVLADGESLEDAPEDADVVIDPDAGEDLTFAGATEALDGTAGFVPAPVAGDQHKFLRGDGAWMDVLQVIRENYPAAEEVAF